MAWHIPRELMNNNPLTEEEVRRRYSERGFTIINYNYVNNKTKLLCYDSEGYIVKITENDPNGREYFVDKNGAISEITEKDDSQIITFYINDISFECIEGETWDDKADRKENNLRSTIANSVVSL